MKEALKTARFLVRLSKKKKDDDSDVLAKSLRKAIEDPDPQPENLAQPFVPRNNALTETPKTNSSGEDWNLDVLNNTDFDWNFVSPIRRSLDVVGLFADSVPTISF